MKIKDIITKKDAEIIKLISEEQKKLAKLRFEIATKESQKSADVKEIRQTIARLKTILREREIEREEKNEKTA